MALPVQGIGRVPKIGITPNGNPDQAPAQKRTIAMPKIVPKPAPTLPKEGIGVARLGTNIK